MTVDRSDILRISASGVFQAEPFVNVFHFRLDAGGAWSDTTVNDILDVLDDVAADDDAFAHMYTKMDAGLTVDTLEAVDLRAVDPVGVQRTVSIAGTSSGNDTPAMLSLVAKWETGFASRRRRGRTFFSGINVGMWNSSDPDRLDSTFAAGVLTNLTEFVDAWVANTDYSFVVFSRSAEEETPGTGDKTVLTAAVNPILGVQRRRRPAA